MKIVLIILIVVFASFSVKSQDLIFLYGGEKIEAKITEVSKTEIRYKKWSYLSGPDWVKKLSDVEHIKYHEDRFLKETTFAQGKTWDFRACSSSQKPKSKKGKFVSGNEIVARINSIYANGDWDVLQSFMAKLPSSVSRDCIHQYYYERYLQACDYENEYDIIVYGDTYLRTGGETELTSVLPTIAKIFAIQGDEAEIERLINVFEKYSKANDDLFDIDIEQLRNEIDGLLHPGDPEEIFEGKWVAIERDAIYDQFNPLIVEINDVKRYNGIQMVLPAYKGRFVRRTNQWQIAPNSPLHVSQDVIFDASNRLLITRFASEIIKDRSGNEEFARSGVDEMHNVRANMMGEIFSSNASIENKMLATGATVLTTGLLERLFASTTISSKSVEAYTFAMVPVSPVTLEASMSHVSGKSVNGAEISAEKELNQRRLFVKWEESDSVYFVSNRRESFNYPAPIAFQPKDKDDPLFWEYNQIRKQEKKGKLIAGLSYGITASTLTFFGVKGLVDHFKNGKPGLVGPVIELGAAFVLVVPYYTISSRIERRADDGYSKINIKNKNKMILKAEKAEKKLSLSPCYNPEINAFGGSLNLNF